MKRYSNEIRNKFNNLYFAQYFTSMKTTGKTKIYHKMKNNISIWKIFGLKSSAELKRNLTAIRISGHCLHKKYIRKKGIERDKRYYNLCDEYEIGTEQHVMVDCTNKEMVKLREQLKSNLIKVNHRYAQFPPVI